MREHKLASRRDVLIGGAALATSLATGVASIHGGQTGAGPTDAPPSAPRDASDPWRGLKVGMASYSFRKLSLDACIKGVQRVALRYVSIKDVHLPLNSTTEQRKQVADAFRKAGIEPISCGVITLKNDQKSARQAFEYARDIGVPTIVCNPVPAALPLLDGLVKEFDIKLAIHNHGPEAADFKSPLDAWKAVQPFDERIGLCIDVGHSQRAGTPPAEAIRTCRARLYDMHFKDVSSAHGKNAASEVEVGRGVIDVKGMLRAILDTGYSHHIGFEHEKDPEDPIPGVAESVGYTKATLHAIAG